MFFAKKHGTCHRAHSAFTHKANKRTLCSVSLKQNHTKSPDALRAVLPLVSGFKLGTGVQRLCRSRSLVAGLLFCPSFSSGSLCCPLHRSNDGTTRIFLPFSKVCTLPYSSPFRPECSGVSDIPASRLPQLCTRCKGFSLYTLSYTSHRTGGCLFKKNLQHFAFFEQQKRVPAKMQCTILRTIILWEHVL